jgi:hypothetical protein
MLSQQEAESHGSVEQTIFPATFTLPPAVHTSVGVDASVKNVLHLLFVVQHSAGVHVFSAHCTFLSALGSIKWVFSVHEEYANPLETSANASLHEGFSAQHSCRVQVDGDAHLMVAPSVLSTACVVPVHMVLAAAGSLSKKSAQVIGAQHRSGLHPTVLSHATSIAVFPETIETSAASLQRFASTNCK